MDNTIDSLQIEIESNFKSADNGINKLKNSIKKLVEINENLASMNSNSSIKIRELASSLEKLKRAGDGIGELANQLKSLSKLNLDNLSKGPERAAKLADAIKKTQEKDTTFDDKEIQIEARIDTEQVQGKLSGLASFLSPVAEKFKWLGSLGSSVFYTIGSDGEKEFTKLGSACNSALNGLKTRFSSLRNLLKGVFTDAAKLDKLLLKGLSNSFGKASKKAGSFMKSIGRIAVYRAIRMALSAIANGLKEGVKNLYSYSQVAGTKFAPSMDKIATSTQYLKNSLGAMAAPLINSLAPAIDMIVDKLVGLINMFNQLFARLTGASTWTKAVKGQKKFAAAAGGSAKAVKSLTMGFDELNILSKDSGGGGGGAAADVANMFEEMKVDPDFMKDIDFNQIGVDFAKKLNEAMSHVNGEELGRKLGTALSNAFETMRGFVDTFDWQGLGQLIADNVNGIIYTFDLTNAVLALQGACFGLLDTLSTIIGGIDWNQLGRDLANAIGSIDLKELGGKIGTLLSNTAKAALDAILGIFSTNGIGNLISGILPGLMNIVCSIEWGQIVIRIGMLIVEAIPQVVDIVLGALQSIPDALGTFFHSIGMDGIGDFFDGIAEKIKGAREWLNTNVIEPLGDFFQDLLNGRFKDIHWNEVFSSFIEFILNIPTWILKEAGELFTGMGKIFEDLGLGCIGGLFKGIGDALKNVGTWLKEHLVDPVVNWVKDLFGIHSPSTVFMEIGGWLIQGLFKGISDIWHTITDFFGTAWENLKKGFEDTWNGIKKKTTEIWNGIKDGITKTWDNVKTKAKETWDNMKKKIGDTWENVKTKTSTVWKNIKTDVGKVWDGFKTKVKDTWDNMKKKIGDTWENVKKTTGEKWGNVKDSLSKTWDYLKEHGDDFTGKIKGFVTDSWENIKKTTSEKWDNVKTTVKGVWDDMTTNSDTTFSTLKDTICGAWNGIHDHISGVVSGIGGFFSDLVGNITDGVRNISRGFDDMTRDADRAAKNINNSFNRVNSGGGRPRGNFRGWSRPTAYASGGYPKTGELFLAREAGAEMVGSIGGRTAVANNDQIVAGIYQGVLAAMNNSNKGNTDFDVKVYLDGKQVTSAVEKRQRERGANIYGGGVLNGV
jgi:phage-related protein